MKKHCFKAILQNESKVINSCYFHMQALLPEGFSFQRLNQKKQKMIVLTLT